MQLSCFSLRESSAASLPSWQRYLWAVLLGRKGPCSWCDALQGRSPSYVAVMHRKHTGTLPRQVLDGAESGVASAVALASAAVSGSGTQASCENIRSHASGLPISLLGKHGAPPAALLQAVHAAAHSLVALEKHIAGTAHSVSGLRPLLEKLEAAQNGISTHCSQLAAAQESAQRAIAAATAPLQQQQQHGVDSSPQKPQS